MDDDQSTNDGPIPPKLTGPDQPADIHLAPILNKSIEEDKPSKKQKRKTINQDEIIRKWRVIQMRMQRSLQVLMSREMKINVTLTPLKTMFRRHIIEMIDGQISYLKEMTTIIKNGEDELSQELMEEDLDRRASTQVFETLIEIIEEEKLRFNENKPDILDIIEKDLKRFKDARLETRACFWILWSFGLQLHEIHSKAQESLEIVLDVILHYPPALRRVLGIFLHFAYNLVRELPPYPIDSSRTSLIIGPGRTGYNMAPWIKYRYGTNSQSYMEYERFLTYYTRSFGSVPGNAPDFTNGPKDGYKKWIGRTLVSLENSLRKSPLIIANSKGNTLEGMMAGMIDELNDELEEREYEPEYNKLINQPIGGEGALKFIEWLFETAINRNKTTNISSHGNIRLSFDMIKFISGTKDLEFPVVRWINEFGERLVMDWLDPEQDDQKDVGKI